jgi:hypothetical protein
MEETETELQGRRFLPEQVMEATTANPERMPPPRKSDLHLISTI